MTDDIKPVAWAIFRDGALDWEHDWPFSDEPQSMMDDEESRPLYGGEVIAEIERLRADRDDVRAELTNLQIAFNDWKVTHSTVRLEVEIERLRADAERYRWLRDPANAYADEWNLFGPYSSPKGIDAAIDAAVEEESGEQSTSSFENFMEIPDGGR